MNQSGSVFCNICKVFLPSEASYEFHLTTPKHLTKMHDGNLPDYIPATTVPLGSGTAVTSAPSSIVDATAIHTWAAEKQTKINNVHNNNVDRTNIEQQHPQTTPSTTSSQSKNNSTNVDTHKINKKMPIEIIDLESDNDNDTKHQQTVSEHSSKSDHKKSDPSADVMVLSSDSSTSEPISTPNRSRIRRRSPSPEKDSPLRDRTNSEDQEGNALRNSSEIIQQKRKKPRNEGPVNDSAATFEAVPEPSNTTSKPTPAKKVVDFPEYIPLSESRPARHASKPRDSEVPTTVDVTRSMDLDGTSNYQPHHTPMTRPPWAVHEYPRNNWGLHEEIKDFCRFMSPTPAERAMRKDVIARLTAVVKGVWPDAEIFVFGSIATELYLPSSDIDMVVIGAPAVGSSLYILAQNIERKGISKEVQVIDKARVPIVKLMDSKTGTLVDISFNKGNGPENSRLVRSFMKEHRALKYLVLVLKCFLQQRQLNEPYSGGVGSYALILMIVSFLQANAGETNLGALLTEFMHLYGVTFNYFTVGISVREGGFYFSKVEREWYDPARPYQICLEDPNDLENDVGRSSFKILNVRRAFEYGYKRLSTNLTKGDYAPTVLTRILYPDFNMLAHRMYIHSLYPNAEKEEEFASNASSDEEDSSMSEDENEQAPDEGFSSDSSSSSLQVDENLLQAAMNKEQNAANSKNKQQSSKPNNQQDKPTPNNPVTVANNATPQQNNSAKKKNKSKNKTQTAPQTQSVHTTHHHPHHAANNQSHRQQNNHTPHKPNNNHKQRNANSNSNHARNQNRRRSAERRT